MMGNEIAPVEVRWEREVDLEKPDRPSRAAAAA